MRQLKHASLKERSRVNSWRMVTFLRVESVSCVESILRPRLDSEVTAFCVIALGRWRISERRQVCRDRRPCESKYELNRLCDKSSKVPTSSGCRSTSTDYGIVTVTELTRQRTRQLVREETEGLLGLHAERRHLRPAMTDNSRRSMFANNSDLVRGQYSYPELASPLDAIAGETRLGSNRCASSERWS
jgi:hypothetical protein